MKYTINPFARHGSPWRLPQRCLLGFVLAASSLIFGTITGFGQSSETGTIHGRVQNGENGQYLNNVQIRSDSSTEETFTNEFGEYTLSKVTPGSVTIKATYNGQEPLTAPVTVVAGKTVEQNLVFNKPAKTNDNGELVLNEYVIETNRFKNAQEIAVNEERTSVTLKNVLAADAFGKIANGNIGEFVKYMPGVQVDYGSTDNNYTNGALANQISIRGFGPQQTSIMIDGRQVADPSPGTLSRAIGLDMLSINNASRVEVIKVATPDMPSTSPGGAVNLITKNAFEYAKPELTVSAQAAFNTTDTKIFEKEAGPANKKTFHTLPGGDISYVFPVNDKLGITLSVSSYNEYSPGLKSQPSYTYIPTKFDLSAIGGSSTGNITDAAGEVTDLTHPFINRSQMTTNPWADFRVAGALRFDWKPIKGLVINGKYNYSSYNGVNVTRRMQYSAADPMDWGPTFTIGRPYVATTASLTGKAMDPGNKVAQTNTALDKSGDNNDGSLTLKYDNGPWHINAGASRAVARGDLDSTKNGHFSEFDLVTTVGQVSLLGINQGTPSSIVVKDRAGNPFDTTKLSGWTPDSIAGNAGQSSSRDTISIYNIDLRRDLDFLPIDMSIKTGVYRNVDKKEKWGLGTNYKYAYIGPTISDLSQFTDSLNTESPGFGLPGQQWGDTYKFYNYFKANPSYFSATDASVVINNYNNYVAQNQIITETRDSYYAMLDGHFFHGRLSYVGGIRAGRAKDKGRGPFTDGNYRYVENPDGSIYKDSVYPTGALLTNASVIADTALKARLAAAGITLPDHVLDTTSLEARMRNLQALHPINVSTKDPVTPTIAMSYNITDNLIFKGSWSKETLLPVLQNGNTGLLSANGSFTISDNIPSTGDLGGDGKITVSNPTLRPEVTQSWNFTLSYYTKNGGTLSLSYYLKNVKNQWETDTIYNTGSDYATILTALGLTPTDFPNYAISTTENGLANAHNNGFEVEAIQNLGLISDWGKHFDVFATFSHKKLTQSVAANVVAIGATADDLETAGIRFNYNRIALSFKGTHRNATIISKGSLIPYNGLNYQLYNVNPAIFKMDVELDYQISKHFSYFASAANVTNSESYQKTYDFSGVLPQWAYITTRNRFGTEIITGVTARF